MSTSAAISELKEGMTLGPYRIERKIGQGGMGHVFLAVEERLGRKVALKTLAAWATHDQDSLTRFSSEAKALAMVRHPNVVTVHASDCIGGVHFIAMEYIEGVPLSEVCMNLALPAVEAVPLILQVLEGLSALHDKAIIHRDIKPQNLLLQRDGLVKIVDLGVAKIYAESSVQTVAGIVLGTGNYLAPEVAAGQPATTRSDLWATGAVLYELMTGTPLVPGRNLVDSLRLLASFELRLPQESLTWIPAEFRDLIKRMCARDPQERWASA
ncbi:MAG: serine/threonine-protein kinase, partial [Bdellovibrionales bacterium]